MIIKQKNIDSPQQDRLTQIKAELDAGGLRNVRDVPIFWKVYTSLEIEFILNYLKINK